MTFKPALGALALGLSALFVTAPVDAAPPFEGEKDGAYTIDPDHSSVIFRVSHLGISSFYGRFNDVSGTVVVDNEDASKSSVQVMIRAASVDTNSESRDKHIKSPDFLNAKQFPDLVFESTKVKRTDGGDLEVTGEFTMHGVTKKITATAKHIGHGERGRFGYRTGYETTFTLMRSDFGMKYMLEGLGDDITITMALEASKD